MNANRTCPKCAAPLPADAPQGHCPQCLLALALEAKPCDATQAALDQATQDSGSSGAKTSSPALLFTPGEKVRYFGDYELLEEVARGGMGVVFRARQQSLNRIVAVKMILGGQLATEADVKRFRTEAEAAANLQHPNIVAIHEIGEHEGRHYFSMDFVEGKNLAQVIGGEPMSPVQSATLLKTLAEAVHYAHQRGTLHRDLKPHNVLIDPHGQPHITDFGLAKRIEQASDLTQEGSVMGSPSYMPPEQATGRQADIGPASDVYSLGAILYQMLTGKVPFSGATAVDTLRAVVEQEPVAPAKLNDRVPADLETICLKCLEKKPERRYASARALAEELARFLNHEPILARPASAARKLVSWCRQRPWVLTGAAVFVVMGLIGLAFGLWQQNELLQWRAAHPRGKASNSLLGTMSWLFLTGFALWLVSTFSVVHLAQTNRLRARSQPKWQYWLVIGAGLLQIALSIALALLAIRNLIWLRAENLAQASIGMFVLAFAFALCWTGVLFIWRFSRLDDLLGLGQASEGVRFKLAINWAGVLLWIPVFGFTTALVARWLIGHVQFEPPEGLFPDTKGPIIITDAALRKSLNDDWKMLFASVSGPLALAVCFLVSFWKMPRNEWRDLTPPTAFMCFGYVLMFGTIMPKPLAAAGLLWGLLSGLALLKVANLRRIELPKGVEATKHVQQRKINDPALHRAVPIVWLGLIACGFLLVPGPIETKAFRALLWICASTLGLVIAACRPTSRKQWGVLAAGCFTLLFVITDGLDNVRRFKALADPEFLRMMWPAFVAAFFIYRAATKPPLATDDPPKPQP